MQIFQWTIIILTILANALIAVAIYQKNPKSATHRLLSALSIITIFWTVFTYLALAPGEETIRLLYVRLVMFFTTPYGTIILLLAMVYPNFKLMISKKLLWGIGIFNLFTALLALSPFMFTNLQNSSNGSFSLQPGPGIIPFAVGFVGFMTMGFIVLIKKYRKSEGLLKEQLKIFILGIVISFTLLTLTNFIAVLVFKTIQYAAFGPPFTLILFLFTTYAILRHRFLDIRLIIARSVAYFIAIVIIALTYSAVLFGVSAFFTGQRLDIFSIVISIFFTLFIALTFQPLRRLVEKATDDIFYKDHYDSNQLLWDLSRSMASSLNLSKLTKDILVRLLNSMRISYGAVVLIRDNSIIWVGSEGKVGKRSFKGKDILKLIHDANKKHQNEEHILVFDELTESNTKNAMRDHELTLILPLVVRNELIGGILLGDKSSGEIYSSDDINVLKIIAPEIAVAVKNALSFEEIKRFNITLEEEVKRATARLRKANQRLKELDALKDEFVSIASHELRTPMTAIKSYIWMALNQPEQEIKEPLKKYLDISYNSTERLIRLVNDMLTVSRIERNKIEINLAKINIIEVLQLVYDELVITAKERRIDFTLENGDKAVFVKADKDKIREVFQNLIGNALKFTPEKGKISVHVEKKKKMVHVSISDTGPGIRKQDMDKLFEKFGKIEYSYSKHSNQPGTGLGLYISKQIVSMHNGTIEVDSEVGVGTTFTVIIPAVDDKGGD